MINGELVANDDSALVRLVFTLRAAGHSYSEIESLSGVRYSTARHIIENRVYLGEVRLRDEWFAGQHQALVTEDEWVAARRPHIPGRRRSRDLLSGRVRCGLCRRIVGIDYNERGQAIYRCRHRGKGCNLPGRSANGLERAAVLGLRLIARDEDLQTAIRTELVGSADDSPEARKTESAARSIDRKLRKLLDLHYADRISPETFAAEEARLTKQLQALNAQRDRRSKPAQSATSYARDSKT
jgi:hypothetical protein